MARLLTGSELANHADGEAVSRAYRQLLEREEQNFARRGRLVLLRNGEVTRSDDPPPTLKALRAGEPVVIYDHMLPRDLRPGDGLVKGLRLKVWPDGRIIEVED